MQGSFIQWYTGIPGSGTAVGTGASGEISGANTETLTFNPPAAGDFTTYFVIVGNGTTLADSALTATSSVVTLSKLSISGSFVASVQALNPVGFWPLNESSGTVAYNWGSLGAVANGVYVADPNGSSTYTLLGVAGPNYPNMPSAMAFELGSSHATDMSGAGVYVPNQPGLELSGSNSITRTPNPVSIAEWVQVIGTPTWFQSVTGKGDDSYRTDEEEPNAGWNAHASSDLQSTFSLADGKWHFWVGTWDGIKVQNLYIDGLLAGNNTVSPNTGGNSHQFFIGGAPDYVGRNFSGNIATVAVFNYAFTAAQAAAALEHHVHPRHHRAGQCVLCQRHRRREHYRAGARPLPAMVLRHARHRHAGFQQRQYLGSRHHFGVGPPILTFTASGSPLALPPGDYGTYYLVVGDNNGNFVTSSVVTFASLGLGGTFDNAVLALNPIAYWPLNEPAGNVALNYTPTFGPALNGVIQQNSRHR